VLGYYVTFSTRLGKTPVRLDSVQLVTEKFNKKSEHYYGNLGKDFIGQFQAMTIDFERMDVVFTLSKEHL
jgi:hypothetical protein